MSGRALLLVGHGSSFGSGADEPVYAHAARIRARRIFDEIHVAFWKQEPHVSNALANIRSRVIDVVPMFLADGFFAREVLPEALGLRGPITQLGEQTVFYRPPVGVHPAMATLTLRRALVRELDADERSRAALVIVGHGTLRNAESARAVRVLCERIRRRARFAIIEPAYLDEPPLVAAVVAALPHRNIVVVPYLLSEGWHTRRTIPDALQLSARRTDSAGRVIWYTPAVGTHAQLARVAVACTRSAASRRHRSDVDATTGRRT